MPELIAQARHTSDVITPRSSANEPGQAAQINFLSRG
jgi:hypothetical protein